MNELKKSSMPRSQAETLDKQARNLNIKNYETVDQHDHQLDNMNRVGRGDSGDRVADSFKFKRTEGCAYKGQ